MGRCLRTRWNNVHKIECAKYPYISGLLKGHGPLATLRVMSYK